MQGETEGVGEEDEEERERAAAQEVDQEAHARP